VTVDRSGCAAKRHGTAAAYSWTKNKCRCDDAREAYRIYRKRLREGRHTSILIDSTGGARRLQSLIAAGHNQHTIAELMDVSNHFVFALLHRRHPTITRDTDRRIRAVFKQLDGTRGTCRWAPTIARRNGWADAAAWDNIDDPAEKPKLGDPAADVVDEVLVDQVLAGTRRARLSKANIRHAIARGAEAGMTPYAIGERVRRSSAVVKELAAEIGLELAA
jgi:hypothetical protein